MSTIIKLIDSKDTLATVACIHAYHE